MLEFLLNGGYVCFLAVHFLLVGFLCLYAAVKLTGKWNKLDFLGVSLLVCILSAASFYAAGFEPNVFCDEFYYAASAENMTDSLAAYPKVLSAFSGSPRKFDYFLPPYPQGWSYLQACCGKITSAFSEGLHSGSAWMRGVYTNKILLSLTALILFAALRISWNTKSALAACAAVMFMPVPLYLSSGASAELSCLFGASVFFLFLQLWNNEGRIFWLVCLGCAGAFWGEMRPEGGIGASLAVFFDFFFFRKNFAEAGERLLKKIFPNLNLNAEGGFWADLKKSCPALFLYALVFIVLWWPALIAVMCHPPELEHHFQMLPRAGMGVWENRTVNILNNLKFFADNKIFPISLTVLSLLGICAEKILRRGDSNAALLKVQLLCFASMTMFLSMYPFGDYSSTYSFDSWRFAYTSVIPAAACAAQGIMLAERYKIFGNAAVLCLAAVSVCFGLRFEKPPQHQIMLGWDRIMQKYAGYAEKNSLPIICADQELCVFCQFRWQKEAFFADKDENIKNDYKKALLLIIGERNREGELEYNLSSFYSDWDIRLIDEYSEAGLGIFSIEKMH